MARTRSTLAGRAPRRKMIWVRDVGASPAATPTGATDLLTDFRALNGGAQPLGVTVTRMRGLLSAQVSASPTFLTDMTVGAIVLPRTIPEVRQQVGRASGRHGRRSTNIPHPDHLPPGCAASQRRTCTRHGHLLSRASRRTARQGVLQLARTRPGGPGTTGRAARGLRLR